MSRSASPTDANATVRTVPVAWSTSNRHGEPLAPDASVSPRPTAISASNPGDTSAASAASAAWILDVARVCKTKESVDGAIS